MPGETNRVLRLHGIRDLRFHDEPIPIPKPGETLIRVTAVGICGSDIHWVEDGAIGPTHLIAPLILGHEAAGIVVGGEMTGQRVAIDPNVPCGTCESCEEGNPNLCPTHRFAGNAPQDGAMCTYIAWPTHCLYLLPDSLTDVDGAMLEPLGVAMHTVELGHIKPGMIVGVFGCGPIGLLTIQMAKVAGAAMIIATDKLSHRLDAARALGASVAVQASDAGHERTDIQAITHGRGIDVAFEAAGENAAVETAIDVAKPGATVVLCGIPSDDRTTFGATAARRKGLTIKLVRRMKHTYPRAIRLVENGLVDVRAIVSQHYALEEAQKGFIMSKTRQGLKIVLQP